MALFNEFSGKIKNVGQSIAQSTKNVGQNIAHSTKNFADVTKLKKGISDNEKQIKGLYTLLGKAYYDCHKDDSDAEDKEFIEKINVLFKQIDDLKQQIKDIEGLTKCPNCGKDVPNESLFCNNCGYKFPKEQEGICCSNCGKPLAENSMFCTHCGTKVKQVETKETNAETEDNSQKRCTICHAVLKEVDSFCPECGTPVNQNSGPEEISQ